MIQIEDKILSLDLFEKHFCCDLPKCVGICCVYGESGAPLDDNEVDILAQIYPRVKPYLKPEGIAAIEEQGTSVIDSDNDNVTPLINGNECAYSINENGITFCAIEKAHRERIVDFPKPISCHLYPIRTKRFNDVIALNYHKWDVCKPARELGHSLQLPVYKFLKTPLIRAFGEEFYKHIEDVAEILENEGKEG